MRLWTKAFGQRAADVPLSKPTLENAPLDRRRGQRAADVPLSKPTLENAPLDKASLNLLPLLAGIIIIHGEPSAISQLSSQVLRRALKEDEDG